MGNDSKEMQEEMDATTKWYRQEFQKPVEEIRQDIFFRADNFEQEEWYGEFEIYRQIGVCSPLPEHTEEVRKALKIMGCHTQTAERDGHICIVPERPQEKGRTRKKQKEHEGR